jgi:Tfp pilus assembly protein PilN
METANEKQNTSSGKQAGNEQQQTTGGEKTTSNTKAWWEQLAGNIPDDKEGVKNWYRLLSNPLIVIVGLLILGYWLVTQKQGTVTNRNMENEQLKKELKKLKKKYKKLKTGMPGAIDHVKISQRRVVLD